MSKRTMADALIEDARARNELMTCGPDGQPQYARLARLWLCRRTFESYDSAHWLRELGKLLVATGRQWE